MNERPREFGDVPGYEFDVPRASGQATQGPGAGQARRQTWPQPPPTPPPSWPPPPPPPQQQQSQQPQQPRQQPWQQTSPSAWLWDQPQQQPPQWRPPPPPQRWQQPPQWQQQPPQRQQPQEWRQPPPAPAPPRPAQPRSPGHARSGGLGRDILAAMRARNLFMSLALPLLAAIAVGIAAVVIVGANNTIGSAPTAIDAGFPPARLATADFGGAGGSPVQLSAIAAAGPTEVAAGSARGDLALWVSGDGGSTWQRGSVRAAGGGQLAGVAHGASGWLAVGQAAARVATAAATPIVLGSQGGQTWTSVGGTPAFAGNGRRVVTAAVAAGGAGYVIVGHTSVGARTVAAAWYAPGRTGWRRASGAQAGALDGPGNRVMSAVTATSRGFAAVGAAGGRPAAWLSATGRTWTLVTLPLPAGTASAALNYVAANGRTVAAVGTEVTAAGQRLPFAAVSADAGATWTLAALPLPGGGTAAAAAPAAAATALTAAGGGFTATGTYGLPGQTDVVIWTLPAGAAPGTAWTTVAPQGTGLSGKGMQAITALTATGDTLIGIGRTTAKAAVAQPTIWQSPVRS